jgi:uncharacterized repeat protein (TIGR03943 family)
MNEKFKRPAAILTACLPALIYIIWLHAFYWLLEGSRYTAMLQPKLWPLLILALILLLAFSAAFISQFTLKTRVALHVDVWIKAAILILPVVYLWTVYGQSLGADAFEKRLLNTGQRVSIKSAGFKEIPSQASSGNPTTLLDLILYPETFDGQRVAIEGMVYRGATVDNSSFKLFRFAVACCAADALPFSIQVKTAGAGNFPNDAWVRVEGLFKLATINDKPVSSIVADKVMPMSTPPPEKRYLFF